jgi:hypothetical protein
MDITVFLAQLWGPVIFAIGVGIFVSRSYYIKIYRDLEKDTLAVLVFGMTAMAIGLAQVAVHNVWNTLPQIIISFLGWGVLLKGALFIIVPGFVDKMGDKWINLKLIPLAGGLTLLIGAYLTWVAYLA